MAKTTNILLLLVVILLAGNAFQFLYFTELSPPGIPEADVPKDISEVMGNITKHLGKIITLEGYFVQSGSGDPLLLKNIEDFHKNTIIPTENYVQLVGDLPRVLSSERGSWVQIKGNITWADEDEGVGGLEYLDGTSVYEVITRFQGYSEAIYQQAINFSAPSTRTKYAVLLSGGWRASKAYSRYWNDLKLMYSILINKYGYDSQNIIVLYKDGVGEDTQMPVNVSANRQHFNNTFNYLATQMNSKDTLFIYTTNHGYEEGLCMYYYETVSPDHFQEVLAPVSYARMVIVMEQCNSGLFIPALSGPNRVIMTAASATESSWSCDTEGAYDEFVYHFMVAVNMETPTGTAVTWHDVDSNGYISMREAFNYALFMDSRNEHPYYDDNGDGTGLHGYLPLTATIGEEGYYGSLVYL